jgi:hypothetical protein
MDVQKMNNLDTTVVNSKRLEFEPVGEPTPDCEGGRAP